MSVLITQSVGGVDSGDGNAFPSQLFPRAGQSFLGNGKYLYSFVFRMKKNGSPGGNLVARLRAHTGPYGSGGYPTGSDIAVSDNVAVSGVSTSDSNVTFNFTGSNRVLLTNGTPYVLIVDAGGLTGHDSSNRILFKIDNNSNHNGNFSIEYSGSWTAVTGGSDTYNDYLFSIYGVSPPTLTTSAPSSVTQTTATGNGEITNLDGESATTRGFVYMAGTSGTPTLANSVSSDSGTFSTGAYTKTITGLLSNTDYRISAFATTTKGGTSYSGVVSFKTLDSSIGLASSGIIFSSDATIFQKQNISSTSNMIFDSNVNITLVLSISGTTNIMFDTEGYGGILQTIEGNTTIIFSTNNTDTYIIVVDDNKTYLYKIYDPITGDFLGSWKDVKSELQFSQEINQAGSNIEVELARSSDSIASEINNIITDLADDVSTDTLDLIGAETTSVNQIGAGSNVDLNLDVKIYVFYKNQPDIEGRLIFTGYISRYVNNYGSTDNTEVSLFSYGADLDNYILEDSGKTRIDYFSQDPSNILKDTFDIFNSDGGIITYTDGVPGTPIVVKNLFSNPSMETNTTGWTLYSGIGTRESSGGAAFGTYYYNLVNSGGGYAGQQSPNLEVGKTYVFSVYVKKPALGSIIIDGAHDSSIVFTLYPSPGATWQRYSATIVATAASPLYVDFTITGSDNAVQIDALSLTDTTTLINYFDGSTTDVDTIDYTWTGTANASISTKTDTPLVDASIEPTGSPVTYRFNTNTMLEVIKAVLKLAPTDWFWYVDMATNLLYFKPRPTEVSHVFTLGKHIKSLNLERSIEGIVNTIYYTGGKVIETDDYNLFKKYVDTSSVSAYRRGVKKFSDDRVKLETSMDIIAESEIDRGKEPRFRSSVTILDKVYDIESIKLGQLIGFSNFGNSIDNLKMQIVRIGYSSSEVKLQLDTLLPSVPKRLEDLKRNLEQSNVIDNPDTPDI